MAANYVPNCRRRQYFPSHQQQRNLTDHHCHFGQDSERLNDAGYLRWLHTLTGRRERLCYAERHLVYYCASPSEIFDIIDI